MNDPSSTFSFESKKSTVLCLSPGKGDERKKSVQFQKVGQESWQTPAPDIVKKILGNTVDERRRLKKKLSIVSDTPANGQHELVVLPPNTTRRKRTRQESGPIERHLIVPLPSSSKIMQYSSVGSKESLKIPQFVPPTPLTTKKSSRIINQEAALFDVPPSTARRMVTRRLVAIENVRLDSPVDIFSTMKKQRTKPFQSSHFAAELPVETPISKKISKMPKNIIKNASRSSFSNTSGSSFVVPDIPQLRWSPKTPATFKRPRNKISDKKLLSDTLNK